MKFLLCARLNQVTTLAQRIGIRRLKAVKRKCAGGCGELVYVSQSAIPLIEGGAAEPRCDLCIPPGQYTPEITPEMRAQLVRFRNARPEDN